MGPAAATGEEGKPSWDDLARLTGIPEIGELTEVDTAKEAYDKETIMTPEEIEAESVRKYNEILRKARATRQAIADAGRWTM